jgi:hypothetical protein
MAEDIKENEMTTVNSVDYVRGLKGKNSVLIIPSDLAAISGLYRINKILGPGEQFTLPLGGGLIMIQNQSKTHEKALALISSRGTGDVIVSENTINFFSEVEDKICVYNSGAGTAYVVKNTHTYERNILITFII